MKNSVNTNKLSAEVMKNKKCDNHSPALTKLENRRSI